MDMKVNSQRIKQEREKRAWSQEHLAGVAELGLRTVQRIETTGSASFESVKALAAVLDMEIADLKSEDNTPFTNTALTRKPSINFSSVGVGALIASILLVGSFFIAQPIFAKAVKLDFDISVNDGANAEGEPLSRARSHQIVDDTKTTTIQLPNQLRVEVTPKIQADINQVLLLVKMFEYTNGDYAPIGTPKLMTEVDRPAEIRVETDSGKLIKILLTPTVQ